MHPVVKEVVAIRKTAAGRRRYRLIVARRGAAIVGVWFVLFLAMSAVHAEIAFHAAQRAGREPLHFLEFYRKAMLYSFWPWFIFALTLGAVLSLLWWGFFKEELE